MKIYIMTDMEGVCGVVSHDEWVTPQGRYYEEGKKLLTLEVNAAIEGLAAAGGSQFLVVDGHGHGGINHLLLDPRAEYARGPVPGPYPFFLDETFDAMIWIGQHAKASTTYAQMAHTGWFNVVDVTINGLSVGEFGQFALMGAELGVRSIFGSGDQAFTQESTELVQGFLAVSVKRGVMQGRGEELTTDQYKNYNNGAIHLHPEVARERIRIGAEQALKKFIADPEQFEWVKLEAPYRREISFRAEKEQAAYVMYAEHPSSIVDLLNKPLSKINTP